jgi:hypothetical protein
VVRFHNALRELTSRRGIRNDVSRYEAVSMVLVDPAENPGQVLETYPRMDSPLRIERFFEALYLRYPAIAGVLINRSKEPDTMSATSTAPLI